jgi:GNAT superfamily N-acetyltransferase
MMAPADDQRPPTDAAHTARSAPPGMVARLSRPEDRDQVLRFIAEMGFNRRDAATWNGLDMVAMTAWRGNELIGAIPLEPRPLQVRPGRVIRSVHQTTVAVAPELRGQGIGSRMQQAILALDPPLAPLATVFREEPDSPAYRWYHANGFRPVMTIHAWQLDPPPTPAESASPDVRDPGDPAIDWAAVDGHWQSAYADRYGGFICRAARPLRDWLEVHPYRNRYAFKLLRVHDNAAVVAYAVLGVGQLHSQTTRVEIMEHATRDDGGSSLDLLIRATVAYARQNDYRPIRWAMAAGDPAADVAQHHGFKLDWEFDMLARPLRPDAAALPDPDERKQLWRYHSLDYT